MSGHYTGCSMLPCGTAPYQNRRARSADNTVTIPDIRPSILTSSACRMNFPLCQKSSISAMPGYPEPYWYKTIFYRVLITDTPSGPSSRPSRGSPTAAQMVLGARVPGLGLCGGRANTSSFPTRALTTPIQIHSHSLAAELFTSMTSTEPSYILSTSIDEFAATR